ncbi:Bll4818 protein [Psychrobacter sp. JB385]|nr:Bll4818 protein [Psychrobacter sp. JB385]
MLIAADIMATVVTEPTLRSILVLGFIVLIRTFLSLSLQVELEGRFPWQKEKTVPESNSEADHAIKPDRP